MNPEFVLALRDVVVVGNASTVHKPFLAEADFHVRCNRVPQGAFTNILFYDGEAFDPESTPWATNGWWQHCGLAGLFVYAFRDDAKSLCDWAQKRGLFAEQYAIPHTNAPLGNPMYWCQDLYKEVCGRPFTGFLAIEKMRQLGVRRIYVTGMDFYRRNNELPARVGPHDIALHLRWLTKVALADRRIVLDPTLLHILDGVYHDFLPPP